MLNSFLVGNFLQRFIVSLSNANTHSQQPNLTNITSAQPQILPSRIQQHLVGDSSNTGFMLYPGSVKALLHSTTYTVCSPQVLNRTIWLPTREPEQQDTIKTTTRAAFLNISLGLSSGHFPSSVFHWIRPEAPPEDSTVMSGVPDPTPSILMMG